MRNLKKLAKEFKTNKYDLGYIDIYEKYFENIKDDKLNILEIGIDKGPSLKVWSKYFINSKIAALDIVPSDLKIENVEIEPEEKNDENNPIKEEKQNPYFFIIIVIISGLVGLYSSSFIFNKISESINESIKHESINQN